MTVTLAPHAAEHLNEPVKVYRPIQFGEYVPHLQTLIPEDQLSTTSGARKIGVDYLDLDIALHHWTRSVTGHKGSAMTGQIRTGALMDYFSRHKAQTGRGCSKPKESRLKALALSLKLITLVSDYYVPGCQSKSYSLGENHPDYREDELSVWDRI